MITAYMVFFFGLFLGSFLFVIAYRTNNLKSVFTGRSKCDACRRTIEWYDLLPVLSFLYLRGRCRYCHTPLSFWYPLSEVMTGTVFAASYLLLSPTSSIELFYVLFVSAVLIIVFFTDILYKLIPFVVLLPTIILVYAYTIFFEPYLLKNVLLAGFGSAIFFLLLLLITIFIKKKEGMGFGDVVYAFFMGSFLGFPKIVIGLYLAFILGALYGLTSLVIKKQKLEGAIIPFGPFLVIGTFISLLFYQQIFGYFVNILF